jgi:hypothetical protein
VAASLPGVEWVDNLGADVEDESLDLGPVTTLEGPSAGTPPSRVVVDGSGNTYWTVHDVASPKSGSVMALYHGAKSPIILAANQNNPTALAIDTTKVYWVNAGTRNMNDGSVMSTTR